MHSQPPSTRQVALGIFVTGQLFFLASSNFTGMAEEARPEMVPEVRRVVEAVTPGWTKEAGHFWYLADQLARANRMWAQATGQLQSWSLFAPAVSRDCVFPALELHWDDKTPVADAPGSPCKPELVLSENEPVHLDDYFRVGNFRLRRFENNFILVLSPEGEETPEQTKERLSPKIRDHVADHETILLGYLRWRLKNALVRWPGRELPRQVILVLRRYHIAERADAPPYWQGPFTMPIARWQPDGNRAGSPSELLWFDPVSGGFKMLHHE